MENRDNRYNPDGQNKNYDLRFIHEHHAEIFRLTVMGMKAIPIAERLGITSQTVSNVINSKLGRDRIAELSAQRDDSAVDINQVLSDAAPRALEVIKEIMLNEDVSPAVRARAAMDIVGRAGYVAPTKVQGEHLHAHFTAEDIEDLKRSALSRKRPVAVSNQASAEGLATDVTAKTIEAVPVEV